MRELPVTKLKFEQPSPNCIRVIAFVDGAVDDIVEIEPYPGVHRHIHRLLGGSQRLYGKMKADWKWDPGRAYVVPTLIKKIVEQRPT